MQLQNNSSIEVFKDVFKDTEVDGMPASPCVSLVRKLIAVLELIEKLIVHQYDSVGSGYALQSLTRRLRFKLERHPDEKLLFERTGRNLKMEPLCSVETLEKYLLKMLAQQWYDHDRCNFTFVKQIKEKKRTFVHETDFDENGLIYWIGSNAKTTEWGNPGMYSLVNVFCSEGKKISYGKVYDFLNHDSQPLNCHTIDDR